MRLTRGVGVLADFHWQKGQNDPLIGCCFSLCVWVCVCVQMYKSKAGWCNKMQKPKVVWPEVISRLQRI